MVRQQMAGPNSKVNLNMSLPCQQPYLSCRGTQRVDWFYFPSPHNHRFCSGVKASLLHIKYRKALRREGYPVLGVGILIYWNFCSSFSPQRSLIVANQPLKKNKRARSVYQAGLPVLCCLTSGEVQGKGVGLC